MLTFLNLKFEVRSKEPLVVCLHYYILLNILTDIETLKIP